MVKRILQLLKNKENVQLIANFFSLVSIKGFDLLIPLFILPYLVRTLGIDIFGLTQFSLALCMYFGAFIHYGYSITAVREIARTRNNKEELSRKYSAFLSVSILLTFASLVVLSFVVWVVPSLNEYWILHLYTFYFIAMQSLFPSWFFQGMEKMKYIAFINLSTKIMFLISLVMLVKGPGDYLLVPLLNAFAMTISTLISFWIIHKQFKVAFRRSLYSEMEKVIVDGRHAFISLFAPTLYNSTTMFILGYTSSNLIVGIYASATKLIDALNSVALLLSNTFLPFLSRNIRKHGLFSKIMILGGMVLTVIAFIFSEQLILFLYGKENLNVSFYFKILTPMVFFIFVRSAYGPNFLMLIGKDRVYKNIVLYSCLFFFVMAIIIVPIFEIYGAISIMLGTTFVMAALTFIYFRKFRNVVQ
ncbi:MAG: oligosaccharide flippase family protein [Bacteroidia bacterium]|nr:oligosaccharide flippase family protein [Bacteroidia bacterium]NNK53847.1 oligosaccharide flippase family protein [Flavobacteriaceae bacterium]